MRAVVLALVVAACGAGQKPSHVAEPRSLLDHVPADTPYLFVTLEPIPLEHLDRMLTPARELGTLSAAATAEMGPVPPTVAMNRGWAELYTAAGMRAAGLPEKLELVAYRGSAGAVWRMPIGDRRKFERAVERTLQALGEPFVAGELDGRPLWRIREGEEDTVITTIGGEAVIATVGTEVEGAALRGALGVEPPARAMRLDRLRALARERGWQTSTFGYVDLSLLAAARTGECADAYRAIAGAVPRLVYAADVRAGGSELAILTDVDLGADLRARLAEVVTPGLVARASGDAVISAGAAVDLTAAFSLVRDLGGWAVARRLACPELAWLSGFASFADLIAPPISGVRGVEAAIVDWDELNKSATAWLVIHMPNGIMFLSLLAGALGVDVSGLEANGTPWPIPTGMPYVNTVQVAVTDEVVVAVTGKGAVDRAAELVAPKSDRKLSPLEFSVSFTRFDQIMPGRPQPVERMTTTLELGERGLRATSTIRLPN